MSKEEECKWCDVKEWMVDGIFEACNKKVMDMEDDDEESSEEEAEGRNGDIGLAEIRIDSDVEAPAQPRAKGTYEALTIEDFHFCIHRSPDFKDTFSFSI